MGEAAILIMEGFLDQDQLLIYSNIIEYCHLQLKGFCVGSFFWLGGNASPTIVPSSQRDSWSANLRTHLKWTC